MSNTVACVHTVIPLIDLFGGIAKRKAPQLRMLHVLDEPVFERIRNRGRLDSEDVDRLGAHVRMAKDAGARGILVTCSTLSPCVDDLPDDLRWGVLKVDEVLMREAVRRGGKTLIAATNSATLEPSKQTLMKAGAANEPAVALIPDAFAAFQSGDLTKHDELLLKGLLDVEDQADTIVLAQASMAQIMDKLSSQVRAKVLSSPDLAINALLQLASAG